MLFDRLLAFSELTPQERAAMSQLGGEIRQFPARTTIRKHGEPVKELFALQSGWVTSSYHLRDGRRQIVKVHLPGDILGSPSLALTQAGETLTSVTPISIKTVPLEAVAELFRHHPRVAAILFLCAQQERVYLMRRLASVGQSRAISRFAALLLDLSERLSLGGPEGKLAFQLPLTQQELAEMVGITTVHMNRICQQLIKGNVIRREGRAMTLLDISELRKLSCMPRNEWVQRPAWLEALA